MILYEALHDELRLSQRLISDGDEILPRFRILSVEGEYVVLMPSTGDGRERERDRQMRLIADFMAWKMTLGFVLSAETRAPDAITSIAVSRYGCGGMLRRFKRGPTVSFGAVEELQQQDIGDDLLALLPKRRNVITRAQEHSLELAFGIDGEMPAQRLG